MRFVTEHPRLLRFFGRLCWSAFALLGFAAPAEPFGWVEQPPSINRLLGLAWLGGHDAATLAALFGAVAWGHAPSAAQLAAVAEAARPVP